MGAVAGAAIVSLLINLGLPTLFAAVFLLAAVALYNLMAGGGNSASAVPAPGFGKAWGIVLIALIAQLLANFLIAMAVGVGAAANPAASPEGVGLFVQIGSYGAGLLILSLLLAVVLPTTFPRAILVTLCFALVCIIVGAILFGVLTVVGVSLLRR